MLSLIHISCRTPFVDTPSPRPRERGYSALHQPPFGLVRVYDGGKFYFHSAPEGRKIEAVKFCDRASFCVVAADEVLPEKYTTKYKSAVAFGRVRILGDEEKKKAAAVRLGLKYFPAGGYAGAAAEYAKSGAHMCAIEFSVDCMTGKQGKEFLTEN